MSFGTANRSRIEPRPEFAKIVRIDDTYAAPDSVSTAAEINGRFDRLIIQSGTSTAPGVVLRLCLLAGITCGGTIFVATDNLLGTAAGLAVGVALPITALAWMRMQRQRTLRRQLPVLIDGLLQAARQGRGLGGRASRQRPPTRPCRSPTRSDWLSGDCGWGLTLKRRSPTSPNERAFPRCRCS